MTTITGNLAYTAANLYGQTANKTGANAANNQTATATTTNTGTSTAASGTLSVTAALAAAQNSAGYDFATVGQNARTVLDAGLAQYGATPDSGTTDQQWTQIFGGMDRRSQFAVASNQGGQFTAQEQQAAKDMMNNQYAAIGVTDSSAGTSQQLAAYAQKISFLENVSPEEKQTASWAYGMANAKTTANMIDFDSRMPQSSSSASPLVNVLMGAMRNAQSQSSTALDFGSVDNVSQIVSQPWAKEYASQIQSAFAATYSPGTSINLST